MTKKYLTTTALGRFLLALQKNNHVQFGIENTQGTVHVVDAAGEPTDEVCDDVAFINEQCVPYIHPATHPVSMITGLADVATSGSYEDLTEKPDIPAPYIHPATHPVSMITGLADVATSGSYNDLEDKPLQTIDISCTLDKNTPSRSIVFRPTSAAFDTLCSWIMFTLFDEEEEPIMSVVVMFTDYTFDVFSIMGITGVEGGAGMWVFKVTGENICSDFHRLTDGTNILIPEFQLSELIGEDGFILSNIIIAGSVVQWNEDTENPIITAIDGCTFALRLTPAQAIESLMHTTGALYTDIVQNHQAFNEETRAINTNMTNITDKLPKVYTAAQFIELSSYAINGIPANTLIAITD